MWIINSINIGVRYSGSELVLPIAKMNSISYEAIIPQWGLSYLTIPDS